MDHVVGVVALQNFMSPPVLCFVLGGLAGWAKSDLYVPDQLAKGLSMFLMFAIGLQGGIEASAVGWSFMLIGHLLGGILLSFSIPFLCQFLLKWTSQLSVQQCSAISAHYGSISIVTFATAMEFLRASGMSFESSLIPIAALMETPAILAGFLMLSKTLRKDELRSKKVLHEVFLNGAIFLLLGGFFIGCVSSERGLKDTLPFFKYPLKGVLCFFLLDLGLSASRNFVGFKKLGWSLILFGIYMPLVGAVLGSCVGGLMGLSLGGCILLAVLAASASYIAVPSAMRVAFPHIDTSIPISLSLGITFPFNIFVGIPLYTKVVSYFFL